MFESQPANEKRKLLDFVLSNSVWKNGELLAEYRQPFDVLAIAVASEQVTKSVGPARTVENENWRFNSFCDPKQIVCHLFSARGKRRGSGISVDTNNHH